MELIGTMDSMGIESIVYLQVIILTTQSIG